MRLGGLIWIMLGTVFAGIALTTIITVPQLANDSGRLIPLACIGGFVLAIPAAILISRRLRAAAKG